MENKRKQTLIGAAVVSVVVLIGIVWGVIAHFTPSKERMELTEYYTVGEQEILLLLENAVYEKMGVVMDGTIYIDIETVTEYMNKRFFWDSKENILVYTTPTEIIKVEVGKSVYAVNKGEVTTSYPVVKTQGDQVYVALEFVKEYSNIEYEVYQNPDRVVLRADFGGEYLYANVKKDTSIRYEADIKSPILTDIKSGDRVIYSEIEGATNGFVKVMTADGVIGYVKEKYLDDSYYEVLTNDYKEPVYTSIKRKDTVNLAFHQIFSQSGNAQLASFLNNTKGINVLSPTWFSIKNENGEITSLASESYVEQAHRQGIDVWALVDDFNTEINKAKLFERTSSREKLSNELIAAAIRYNLDGINIDFEKITQESSKGYVQFLRELSVKCRANGIVLSVDNYIPMPYNLFYDREEQGIVADYVVVMAYDEHYSGSEESGSVSSVSYVEQAVSKTAALVPQEKIIVALPFYTRLWKETASAEGVKVTSEAYSMPKALTLMENKGVTLEWEAETAQYYGQYEENGAVYKMWLEEERSYEEKLKVAFQHKIAGVGAWKLGLEDTAIWNVIKKYTN